MENEPLKQTEDHAAAAPDSNLSQDAPAQDTPEARIAGLESELAKMKDHALRALAEAENARKRAAKDREDIARYAVSSFAKDLLSVADNLRRALDAVPADLAQSDPRIKNLTDGIEATEREMLKSFDRAGIRKVDPAGEPFNPNYHEVMFEAPGTGKPTGTVIQVIEAGYVLFDRLLRPARVGVAKAEETPPGGRIDTQA